MADEVAESAAAQAPDPQEAADRKSDAWGLVVIFCALVLGAVHYISGWTFDL